MFSSRRPGSDELDGLGLGSAKVRRIVSSVCARHSDSLALVEAGYDLSLSHAAWVAQLTRAVSAELSGPRGTVGYTFERQHNLRYLLRDLSVTGGGDSLAHETRAVVRLFSVDDLERFFRVRGITSSVESCVAPMPKLTGTRGVVDFHGIVIGDQRLGVVVGAPQPRPVNIAPSVRLRWRRICAHLTAVWRLRASLARVAPHATEEAVLTSSGRVLHASGAARSRSAREALRGAVLAMNQARGPLRRRDPDAALSLWSELVAGRWTLVERIESDGRCLVFAHENPPEAARLRTLSKSEARVVRQLLEQRSSARIAGSLGISSSAVSQQLGSALRKLRLPSPGALVMLANGLAHGQRAQSLEVAGLSACLVDAGEALSPALSRKLSQAERQITGWLLDGLSNAEMAELRGRSYSTIANQVARLYDKLGVSSRTELGARVGCASGAEN